MTQYIRQKNSNVYVVNTQDYEDNLANHPCLFYIVDDPESPYNGICPFELTNDCPESVTTKLIWERPE